MVIVLHDKGVNLEQEHVTAEFLRVSLDQDPETGLGTQNETERSN